MRTAPHTVIQNQCFHQCSVILAREWCFLLTGRPPLPLFGHSLPVASSWAIFFCFIHASKAIILLALSFQRATAFRMAFACLLEDCRWNEISHDLGVPPFVPTLQTVKPCQSVEISAQQQQSGISSLDCSNQIQQPIDRFLRF